MQAARNRRSFRMAALAFKCRYVYLHFSQKHTMNLQINRWGNSLAVRLPLELLRQLGDLQEGDRIQAEALGPARLGLSVDAQALRKRRAWLDGLKQWHERMLVTQPVNRDEWNRY
jgi:antitoxin MazE